MRISLSVPWKDVHHACPWDPREFREDVGYGPVPQGRHPNTSHMLWLIEILYFEHNVGWKGRGVPVQCVSWAYI